MFAGVRGIQYYIYIYITSEVLCLHIFVDPVKRSVLTLAGEILCNRNGCYYCYYQIKQQFHFMACSRKTFHLHQTNLRSCSIILYLAVTKNRFHQCYFRTVTPASVRVKFPQQNQEPPTPIKTTTTDYQPIPCED